MLPIALRWSLALIHGSTSSQTSALSPDACHLQEFQSPTPPFKDPLGDCLDTGVILGRSPGEQDTSTNDLVGIIFPWQLLIGLGPLLSLLPVWDCDIQGKDCCRDGGC